MIRLYYSQQLAIGQAITISDEAFHYLARVRRCQVNDQLILFSGNQDIEYTGHITAITRQSLSVNILDQQQINSESPLKIQLAQGICRGEKIDWLLQKSVEIFLTSITPLLSERCNVRLEQKRLKKKLHHWQGIVISACEQSGRCRLPTLNHPASFIDFIANSVNDHNKLILSPTASESLNTTHLQETAPINLLIGPEGGFSKQEVHAARTHGYQAVQFGPRILRTETAPIVAISMLQGLYGDLR